ncbi:hypothetical protein [Deinococcus sp. YIM 77859]|uniref:hypothetical protein n=1 Tax=Deinococcus sp. YIM 77859 TaxID=1540221 RepID=UPI0012E08410|nr:hypothetical protein [Deinococcus sp. YIM 77859]
MKKVLLFSLTGLLALSSCGIGHTPPQVESSVSTSADTLPPIQAATPQQLAIGKQLYTKFRSQSGVEYSKLDWEQGQVADLGEYSSLVVPSKDDPTVVVSIRIDGEKAGTIKQSSTRLVNGIVESRIFNSAEGTVSVAYFDTAGKFIREEVVSDDSLGAQATCAEIKEQLDEARETEAERLENAVITVIGGTVAGGGAGAVVAAGISGYYLYKAASARREANRLKTTYTQNCG